MSIPNFARRGQREQCIIRIESETSLLSKIIECAIISPYIKNENPLSLMIVAKPESGKTRHLKEYRFNKGLVYMTDCTAYGLTRDIVPKLISGEAKTIIIADILTPLAKATKTRASFIAFLNNLIEEGLAKITTYCTILDKEVKANVITSVTPEALEDGRHEWAKLGFLSRFIVFSYSYDRLTVQKILDYYSRKGLSLNVRVGDIHEPRGKSDKVNTMNETKAFQHHIATIQKQRFTIYS
jgi:hypothetical protein